MKWPDTVIKRGNEISLLLDCHTTALIVYVQPCASAEQAANNYVDDGLLYLHLFSVTAEGFKEFGPFY